MVSHPWCSQPVWFVVVAMTRKPLPRGTSPRRSLIFSMLSKTISLSEGASDSSWSKHLRMMVLGVGWSLVLISSFLASSTRSFVMDSGEPAFTHATILQFVSSHSCARAEASCVLPQPRMPTRTVRRRVGSAISAFNCSCSPRGTKQSPATTSGRLPKKTRLGLLSPETSSATLWGTSAIVSCMRANASRLSLSLFNNCLRASCW